MKFLDEAKIYIQSGNGGPGCVSFRREKCEEFGGPDGGNGGRGGDLIFEVVETLNTLIDFRYQQHFKAKIGGHGMGRNRHGANGDNVVLKVPTGTQIYEEDNETLIVDLVEEGERFRVAKGGNGGFGNAHFKTSTNQAPRNANPGQDAEERTIWLRLKLIADAGIVGLPNAGKSTFLATVSAAKPKIADYPFTTLHPNLGVAQIDGRALVIADIPGLIEGAHEGKGLGFQFLRHIQRTAFLLFLIDISEWSVENPVTSLCTLKNELEAYDTNMAKRPFAVLATKIDSQGQGEARQALQDYCHAQQIPCFAISAVTREGLQPLLSFLGEQVSHLRNPCETSS